MSHLPFGGEKKKNKQQPISIYKQPIRTTGIQKKKDP